MKNKSDVANRDWKNATWEGSRQSLLRASLQLTVRERLQRMIALNNTSAALAQSNKIKTGGAVDS